MTDNELRELRLKKQLPAKEMVEVVRSIYPKFDKPLLSKCENGGVYGVQLKADAMKALRVAYCPESPNIKLTYFVPDDVNKKQTDIQAKVDEAIEQYVDWQSAKLGRDINPSYLLGLLMQTGIKRVELEEPQFTKLRDGKDDAAPQLGVVGEVAVSNGGYEDD